MTAASRPIRVLIADDQRVVREGLSMLVALIDDVEVVDTARDGAEAVRLAETHRCVLPVYWFSSWLRSTSAGKNSGARRAAGG